MDLSALRAVHLERLMAAPLQPCSPVLTLSVSPIPVGGAAQIRYLPPPGGVQPVQVSVHDRTGRVVRLLCEEDRESGTLSWDGTDAHGRRVSPGAYFVRLRDGKQEVTRRVVLVK